MHSTWLQDRFARDRQSRLAIRNSAKIAAACNPPCFCVFPAPLYRALLWPVRCAVHILQYDIMQALAGCLSGTSCHVSTPQIQGARRLTPDASFRHGAASIKHRSQYPQVDNGMLWC